MTFCAAYGEPGVDGTEDGVALGNGETIAAGLFAFNAAGPPRRSPVMAGASFHPPFSRRLGGGAVGSVPDIPAAEGPRGGGGGSIDVTFDGAL